MGTKPESEFSAKLERGRFSIRRRVCVVFTEPSMTDPSLKDEVDINNIVKKYRATGELPLTAKPGFYGDVSAMPDYRQAMDIVRSADEAFSALPARVRAEFMNDPAVMLRFLENPENRDRAIELGLVKKVNPVNPAPASPEVSGDKVDKPVG